MSGGVGASRARSTEHHRSRALAGLLGFVGVATIVVSLLVWLGRGLERLPTPIAQVPVLLAAVYVIVGALLAARLPRHPIGWLFLAGGLVMSLVMPLELLVARAYEALRPAPSFTTLFAWLVSSFATPTLIGIIAVAGLVFPDGRLASPRRRALASLIAGSVLLLALSVAFDPSGLIWYPTLPNPFAAPIDTEPFLRAVRSASLVLTLASVGGVVGALVVRYHRGDAVTRVQLRWMVAAGVVLAVAVTLFLSARYVITPDDRLADGVTFMTQVALMLLPVAAAFAITRYHLFGIDMLISRTLVYVPLMGALGGLYVLAMAVFQRIFILVTGETSDAALLVAMFLIATTFTPIRKTLEGIVDGWASRAFDHPAMSTLPEVEPHADDGELREMAGRLVALRRLEARVSAGARAAEPEEGLHEDRGLPIEGRSLPIDEDGLVACPRGLSVPFTTCLGCSRLLGIATMPATVRCRPSESS